MAGTMVCHDLVHSLLLLCTPVTLASKASNASGFHCRVSARACAGVERSG